MELQIFIIVGIALVYLLMVIGAIGSFLPVIPGVVIAFLGVLGFKLLVPDSPISWTFVVIAGLLSVFAQIIDFFMSWMGAKKFGATWRGALGAFIGAFVGIFIPPPIVWIFIGPLVGAFIGEFIGGSGLKISSKAGMGAFIGTVLSAVLKFLIVVFMALYFSLEVVCYYW